MDWINVKDALPENNDEVLVVSVFRDAPTISIGRYIRKGECLYEEAHTHWAIEHMTKVLHRELDARDRMMVSIFDDRKFEESNFYFYALNKDGYYEYKTYPNEPVTYWAKLDLPKEYIFEDE